MSHPIIVALACMFGLLSVAITAVTLRGIRIGRLARRIPRRPGPPLPDGREWGYAYRDVPGSGFWEEVAGQVFAVLVCLLMFIVLLTAP